ncbi:hypothetical protein [Streptomyces sp. NPDC048473]|uniref:hypothetical protein n=1 Tax=Streptomyces sp. NPDC048473 TaxID=3365556 RepID=UPI00371849D4
MKAAIQARYDELVSRLMSRTISHVAPLIAEVLPDGGLRARPLVVEATLKWWRAALWAIPARAVVLAFLVACLMNVESIVDFIKDPEKYDVEPPLGGGGGPGRSGAQASEQLNPVASLIKGVEDAGAYGTDKLAEVTSTVKSLWPLELPSWGIVTPLAYIVMILMLLLALKALYPFVIALTNGARPATQEHGAQQPRPLRARQPSAADEEMRYRPVVVLLLTAADCARTWRAWGNSPALDTPRVSVRGAEYVVRNAWRTRCEYDSWSARMRQRHALKAHAAKVIAALRSLEARQYTDPDLGLVLQELADAFLTIAERYAEGRVGQLLDNVDAVEGATDYEWLRLLGVAGFGVGALAISSMVNMPDGANGLLLGLALLLAGSWLFRHRLTHPMDLIDVLRGADRK